MDLSAIQKALAESGLSGWLLYDFRGSNPIARSVIGFDERQISTRRWFYLIPAQG
jgi:Xaa-Pro aminopeptidase